MWRVGDDSMVRVWGWWMGLARHYEVSTFEQVYYVRPFLCIAQATPALLWNSVLSIPRQHVDAIVFCYVGMNRK